MDDARGVPPGGLPIIAPHTLIGGAEDSSSLNKTIVTFFGELGKAFAQGAEDNQDHARGWHELRMRIAHNRESFDHAVNMGSVLAGQAGTTAQQQTVSPIRTGAADVQAQMPPGAAYPPNRGIDVAAEGLPTALAKQVDATVTPVVATLEQLVQVLAAASASIANVLAQVQPKTAA